MLMAGEGNHRLCANAVNIAQCTIAGGGSTIPDGIPAFEPTGDTIVCAEMIEISFEDWKRVDWLESGQLDFSLLLAYINSWNWFSQPAESGFEALYIGVFSKRRWEPAKFDIRLLLVKLKCTSKDYSAFVFCCALSFRFTSRFLAGPSSSRMGICPPFMFRRPRPRPQCFCSAHHFFIAGTPLVRQLLHAIEPFSRNKVLNFHSGISVFILNIQKSIDKWNSWSHLLQ